NVIGKPPDGEHVGRLIKRETIAGIKALLREHLGRDRLQPRIVSAKPFCGTRIAHLQHLTAHSLTDLSGSGQLNRLTAAPESYSPRANWRSEAAICPERAARAKRHVATTRPPDADRPHVSRQSDSRWSTISR